MTEKVAFVEQSHAGFRRAMSYLRPELPLDRLRDGYEHPATNEAWAYWHGGCTEGIRIAIARMKGTS